MKNLLTDYLLRKLSPMDKHTHTHSGIIFPFFLLLEVTLVSENKAIRSLSLKTNPHITKPGWKDGNHVVFNDNIEKLN
jgi:hypothetical protein